MCSWYLRTRNVVVVVVVVVVIVMAHVVRDIPTNSCEQQQSTLLSLYRVRSSKRSDT